MTEKFGLCVLIVATYIAYMCATWPNSPDGLVLSGVIGTLLYVYGYNRAKAKITEHYEASEYREPS